MALALKHAPILGGGHVTSLNPGLVTRAPSHDTARLHGPPIYHLIPLPVHTPFCHPFSLLFTRLPPSPHPHRHHDDGQRSPAGHRGKLGAFPYKG